VFVQAGKRTGIGAFHPHQLRHTGITLALEMCQSDLRVAKRFSRHASIRTLVTYDDHRTKEPTQLVEDVARQLEPEDEP
jgi:integrase/recombinase XerC